MLAKSLQHLREDLKGMTLYFGGGGNNDGGDGGGKGPGGGGSRGSRGTNRREDSIGQISTGNGQGTGGNEIFNGENNLQGVPAPAEFPIGGGMGMTQEEKNALRRCQDELDDFTRKFKDIYEKIANIEGNYYS